MTKVGPPLDLVDHDETSQRPQGRHGLLEAGKADGVLEIEAVGRILR